MGGSDPIYRAQFKTVADVRFPRILGGTVVGCEGFDSPVASAWHTEFQTTGESMKRNLLAALTALCLLSGKASAGECSSLPGDVMYEALLDKGYSVCMAQQLVPILVFQCDGAPDQLLFALTGRALALCNDAGLSDLAISQQDFFKCVVHGETVANKVVGTNLNAVIATIQAKVNNVPTEQLVAFAANFQQAKTACMMRKGYDQ